MFYICEKRDNNYGIMDTEDNIKEYYYKEQIQRIQSTGINILSNKSINEIMHYIWHFTMNTYEFSNDEFEQVIEFMEDKGKNNFGGSRYDYVNSLKQNYLEVKKLGFDITPSNMFSTSDMLVKDLIDLYNKTLNIRMYERDSYIHSISIKWHLDYEILKKYYM